MNRFNHKIGVNDPCPCGSNVKFKKCCKNPGGKNHVFGEVLHKINERFRKGDCLVPEAMKRECSKKAISSHSISKSSSLKAISRNGLVYSITSNSKIIEDNNGMIIPERVGLVKASTFPGFCSFHDNKIFSCVEGDVFSYRANQCFSLAYRAVCREFFFKKMAVKSFAHVLALSKSYGNPRLVNEMNARIRINDLDYRDFKEYKSRYDDMMISMIMNDFRSFVIEFDGLLPVQCSSFFGIKKGFDGRGIQSVDFSPKKVKMISVNSFASGGSSYFVVSWLRPDDDVALKFVDSINDLSDVCVPGAIVSMLLKYSENCHLSPDWYDALSIEMKERVINLVHPYFHVYYDFPVIANGFLDVGGAKIRNRKFVNYEPS